MGKTLGIKLEIPGLGGSFEIYVYITPKSVILLSRKETTDVNDSNFYLIKVCV